MSEKEYEYVAVAEVDEIGAGQRMILEIDGESIALFNVDGHFYAIADRCSHDDGSVAEGDLQGLQIACPRHGAKFDLETGKALSLPAVIDIPSYPVKVEAGEILVGLPLET